VEALRALPDLMLGAALAGEPAERMVKAVWDTVGGGPDSLAEVAEQTDAAFADARDHRKARQDLGDMFVQFSKRVSGRTMALVELLDEAYRQVEQELGIRVRPPVLIHPDDEAM